MRTHPVPLAAVLATFFAAPLAVAQVTVRAVPGTYPTIPAALAASAPGDVVEIAPGVYPAFDCGIGVTLRAAAPGTVTFNLAMGFVPSTGVSMFFTAPAGETIHVVGVTLQFPAANFTAAQSDPRLASPAASCSRTAR